MNDESIARAMLQDQHWLRTQAKKIQKLKLDAKPFEEVQARLDSRLESSTARRAQRQQNVPQIEFDSELPIFHHREAIATALKTHQVLVVAGETGSGKSTQLPKICLEAGFGTGGFIGHTQPRRIAARSIAARIAEELKSPLGKDVGYKVRFQDKTTSETYIKLMTDGILLAEAAGDRFLEQYEVIILDEAHERSLNIDFLLGMLHGLLQKRKDLRLIITSATIDAERFGEHFATAVEHDVPIIKIEGRTYPVELRYRPLKDEAGDSIGTYEGIVRAAHELTNLGDLLVFLPTERDIREAAKRLRADKLIQQKQAEVLPLYARLSVAEQNKIFHPGNARRIVLATNVAESSLTVPRIHCVIDTGTARISRFSSRLRMQRLPIESVSQASADQRKGRCGRLGPGVCIRLFDEEDFSTRSPFTTPEIRRTNLASVILQAKHLGLGEVDKIPFLDPPHPETVREGYKTLFEIGAVDDHRRLTEIGRTLAKFPVDPRIGRMVLAASDEGCLTEVLIIAAALEVQDPRVRPIEKQQAADQAHEKFVDEDSDFVSFLNLWDFAETQRRKLSRGQFQKLCRQNFLSEPRLREWGEVHRQLRQTVLDHGLKPNHRKEDLPRDVIHQSLLAGLLSCVAYRNDEKEYTGAGGNKFFLWPGSGLFQGKPSWVMAAELVETTKRFGRTVAKINPAWLESAADHLIKRDYSDPHWHEKSQSVMAFERVTLFGLPIVARRRVAYGHLDVENARQVFIEHGLVGQQMQANDHFFRRNAEVREEAEKLAAKTRKREFVLDEYRVHLFYTERLPDDVYDMSSLRRAIKEDPSIQERLCMSIDDLLEDESSPQADDFPPELDVGSMRLPLSYHFEPGSDEDGVTVTVPAAAVSQLYPEQLDWMVPGLLEEKLVALIRSLPKSIRRGLVPAPDTAKKVAADMPFGQGVFIQEVAKRFSEIAGEPIGPEMFRTEKLAPHLRIRVRVVDDEGEPQVESRELSDVRATLLAADPALAEGSNEVESSEWNRDGFTKWEFDEVPREVRVPRGGIEVVLFPAIVDQADGTVSLRLERSLDAADLASRAGIRRLYQLANSRDLLAQVRWFPQWNETVMRMNSLLPKKQLEEQLQLLLADVAFLGRKKLPRSRDEFETRQKESGDRIAVATQEVARMVPALAENYHAVRLAMDRIKATRFQRSLADIKAQLAAMLSEGFLLETPWFWLSQFPRYFQAIAYRIDKLASGGQGRDESSMKEIAPFWNQFVERDTSATATDLAALAEYRWMIEEFRVSLLAQPLGTAVKVSPQRLEKQWKKACSAS